jgi:hypothetical protein
MSTEDPLVCTQCGGPSSYAGMIHLPLTTIYRCDTCFHEEWVAETPRVQQQQQQQQSQKKLGGEGTE